MDKVYWQSRLAGGPDLSTVGYLGLGRAYNWWMYQVRSDVFKRTVDALRLPWWEAAILDVGSGSGFYLDQWLQLGAKPAQLTGSDLIEIVVRSLQERHPDMTIRQVDIGAPLAGLSPNSYDLISAMDVLFHITDDAAYDRAVANLFQLLRPGGALLFSDNFLHGPTLRSEHQVSRSLAQISDSVERAGFKVIDRVPMFVLMNAPVDSQSELARRLWGSFTRLAAIPGVGFIAGALLCLPELTLTALRREGPSTELMVCRKVV